MAVIDQLDEALGGVVAGSVWKQLGLCLACDMALQWVLAIFAIILQTEKVSFGPNESPPPPPPPTTTTLSPALLPPTRTCSPVTTRRSSTIWPARRPTFSSRSSL